MTTPASCCYRCGGSLETLPLPLGRLDECPHCAVQLHVCRMCTFYDQAVPRQCREDDAEDVKEKQRANFCDYFKLSLNAHDPRFSREDANARDQLGALFGDDNKSPGADDADPAAAAEDLFR